MALPELLQKQTIRLLDKFCRERIPCERYQGQRLVYDITADHVTLFEERLDSNEEENWLRTPIARFCYSAELNQWTLHSTDPQHRWQIYQNISPSLNLSRLIKALDDDLIGIFWG